MAQPERNMAAETPGPGPEVVNQTPLAKALRRVADVFNSGKPNQQAADRAIPARAIDRPTPIIAGGSGPLDFQDRLRAQRAANQAGQPPSGRRPSEGNPRPGQPPAQPEASRPANTQRESPIAGVPQEDLDLFLANADETVEGLQQLINRKGREPVLQQVHARVEFIRFQQAREDTNISEEERQRRLADLKVQRIERLKKEYQTLKSRQTDNKREKLYISLRLPNIERELEAEGEEAMAGGGGNEGGGPPETQTQPIPPEDLEREASPERGRQIVDEIRRWEGLKAAGKYKEINWKRLNELYIEHLIHVEASRMMARQVRILSAEADEVTGPKVEKVNQNLFVNPETGQLRLTKTLKQWLEAYERRQIEDNEWEKFAEEVDIYLGEAKRVGLLKDVNDELVAGYRDVRQGILRKKTYNDIMVAQGAGVLQKIQGAVKGVDDARYSRIRNDRGMRHLAGAGELYAHLAEEKFADIIAAGDPEGVSIEGYLANEFHLGEQDEGPGEETYWRLQHGWYIEIYAQTDIEFQIAADSFLSRLEQITAAPEKIFQDAQQFIDILYKSEGGKKLLSNENTKGFIPDLILGMEARIGMFGADNSNERYDSESYKKFMDYVNKDAKGPERWLALTKLLDGDIAKTLFVLDKDPEWELLFSLHGARGQLSEASYAQRDKSTNQGLYNQLYDQLVERMLGVHIKNKNNVGLVTAGISDREFVSLFEGLYRHGRVPRGRFQGDANIRAYLEAVAKASRENPGGQLTKAQNFNREIRLGRIQLEIQALREKILEPHGQQLKTRNGKVYDPIRGDITDLLGSEADANFYKRELSKTRKAVDIALQMYGATGEKSKRGGGVFTVTKIDSEGNQYQDFVPVHEAEKFIQCGEALIKIQYRDDSDVWGNRALWNDYFAQQIKTENIKNKKDPLDNFKAKYRAKMCEAGRERHIAEFKKHGFEAKLHWTDYDAKGKAIEGTRRVMKIKRPKENPEATDDLELVKDNKDVVIKGFVRTRDGRIISEVLTDEDPEEIDADFYTATHHPYANWTGHTYWSYQEEHRHLLLSSKSFDEARRIRDGKLRWQDADPVSVQLLILDPTLHRVKRFPGKQFVEREGKLTMAAVEDSYQSHWRINRELYEAFWPPLGTPSSEIGVYYGLQDFGGFRKMTEHMKARFAENPERFMRRGRRLLPYLHNPIAALSEYMGQGSAGALETIRMMGYPTYRLIGTFALDKFSANAEAAQKAYNYLDGYTDREGNFVEGLLLKPTNNSDKLSAIIAKIPKEGATWPNAHDQNEFCYAIIESLGRLKAYEQIMTVMETRVRNASGALWLEGIDVLKNGEVDAELERRFKALPAINANVEVIDPDTGEVRTKISRRDLANFIQQALVLEEIGEEVFNELYQENVLDEGSTSMNTGSGRHSARMFHDTFGLFLRDLKARGGGPSYPGEIYPYSRINDKIVIVPPSGGTPILSDETIWGFVFSKFVPT